MKHMLDTYLKGNIDSIEAAMPLSDPASQFMLGHCNFFFLNQSTTCTCMHHEMNVGERPTPHNICL